MSGVGRTGGRDQPQGGQRGELAGVQGRGPDAQADGREQGALGTGKLAAPAVREQGALGAREGERESKKKKKREREKIYIVQGEVRLLI